ncbi:hypothetical protein HDU93_003801, partial [Gonapodya sp. JEL0774]
FRRLYRIVPGLDYLKCFASDRSHMRREDGSWQAEPPTYEAIRTERETMNLDRFRMMNAPAKEGELPGDNIYGVVLDEDGLVRFFIGVN